MSIIDIDPELVLPGLLPGAFRGVPFYIPDARHEAGRRIVHTLFPGLDHAAIEDLGLHRGIIEIIGLVVGDDYVVQAEALRAAFDVPGPGMLLHPWTGEQLVVVARPAVISYSATELRVARIRVGFLPAEPPPLALATLPVLLGALASVGVRGAALITAVTGAAMLPVALWSAARMSAETVAAVVSAAAARQRGADAVERALVTPIAAIGAASDAASLGAAVTALPEPIATLAIGAPAPAIAPATAPAIASAVFGPRDGAAMLLALATEIAALDAVSLPERAVLVGASAAILAQGARSVAEIPYESRQEAMAWRARLMAALDVLDAAASAIAAQAPDAIAKLLASTGALRAAVSADIHEAIGRLPSVIIVTPPAPVTAWLIAQHFAGDDPGNVVAMLDDVVRRNRLPHPGIVAGPIEVLA